MALQSKPVEQSKLVDLLEEDKPIANQKFVCVSFVSPEKILKQKEHFFFEQFLNNWDFQKSMEKYFQFLNFVSFKYKVKFEDLTKDFEEFVKEERENLLNTNISDEYKTFVDKKEEDLEKAFLKENNFQTCVRGLKVRGVYPSQEEAEFRCKMLREVDPNHDVYVGPVGLWMPWDPEAYKTGRVEYMEQELNALMHEKAKNETKAKEDFEARVKETRRKAIEENIKNAEKSGNVLTQTIDKDGNLVGINNVNTQAMFLSSSENEVVSVEDIQKELFEGENIITGKTDNGQSLLVSGPFATKKEDKQDSEE
jgi:hypothetical protein